MKIIKGCTRIVICLKRIVFKIPNFTYSWQHFLKGILANIQENDTYKWHPRKELLCPILWASLGGWVLIMKRVDTKSFKISREGSNISNDDYYRPWIEAGLGGDDKTDNYGILNGKVVKIDYAN